MGFNTVAVLFNDSAPQFRRDGVLGARIAEAMTSGWWPNKSDRKATWFGAGRILSQAHADHYQVVVAGMNGGYSLDYDSDIPPAALNAVKSALERHGYVVRKKRPQAAGKQETASAPAGAGGVSQFVGLGNMVEPHGNADHLKRSNREATY